MYLAVGSFDAGIPFMAILSNIPLIFFIGALPISPGGLGTSNAALIELLKPFVSSPVVSAGVLSAGELLFSFSLAWMFVNYIMKVMIGVVSLRFASDGLLKPAPGDEKKASSLPDVTHLMEDL